MQGTIRPPQGLRVAGIALVLGVFASVFLLHSFTPGFLEPGIDASWVAVMGDAADRNARWGVDLAFTYGPATPLVVNVFNAGYVSHTLPLLLCYALLYGLCAALVLTQAGRRPAAIAGATVATALAIVAARSADALFFTLPFLVFLLALAPEPPRGIRRAAILAGGFAMGLAAMTKMTFPLAALPLFVIADAASALRRRLPLLLVSFALGVVAGDLLYGQRLADLPAYVALQGEVVSGYAAAMALRGPLWDLGPFLVLAGALILLLLAAARRSRDRLKTAWLVPLGTAVILFFMFKAGFIRHDLHSLMAWRGLVIVATVLVFQAVLPLGRRAGALVLAVAGVVAFVYEPVLEVRQSGERPRAAALARAYEEWLAAGPAREIEAAAAFLRDPAAFAAGLEARAAAAKAALAEADPLEPLTGTVDILPSMQSRVLAAGLDYRPRPSFQEYSTYTEGLAAANRAFLDGPRAPDWFLFGPESALGWMGLDNRFPNLTEGALWPDLLRLYAPDHRIGSLIALKRRRAPASVPIGPERTVVAPFNRAVPVGTEDGNTVWMTVDPRLSLLGRLAALLYRPPLPGLAVTLEDGRTLHYRFVPALGRAGFVLSPLILNAADFETLAAGRPAPPARRVVSVALDASAGTVAFYDRDVRFGFARLDTAALRDGAGGSAPAPSGSAWERLLAARPGGGLDEAGRIPAEPPAELALPAEGLDHLTLGYGIEDAAWQEGRTAGVCFAVYPADGSHVSLWQACLDPLDRPEDRGPHEVSIDLPRSAGELALATSCRDRCGAGWAYWAKPEDEAVAPAR